MEDSTSIEYSVVLCTHNHADRLRTTLSSLKDLLPPESPWELLIINNASTDETEQVLSNTGWRPEGVTARIIMEPKLGISHARNRGIHESVGKYIVFFDDDETPHTNWLVEYERAIRTWASDALGGRIEALFEEGNRPPWLQDELLGFLGQLSHGLEPKRLTERGTPIFTGNSSYRKAIFEAIGQFDTDLGRKGNDNSGGEDTDLYRRMIDANMNIRWVPDAVIYHRIQSSKLRKAYFLDLHFRQGRMEGHRERGSQSRIPPFYLFPQLMRAVSAALRQRSRFGSNYSLRKEMNVAYFIGYIAGWVKKEV